MISRLFTFGLCCLLLAGCTGLPKEETSTVRPTKPDESEEIPVSIKRLMPEEITPENYKSKIAEFEEELSVDRKAANKVKSNPNDE